jgi:hypothetical protein
VGRISSSQYIHCSPLFFPNYIVLIRKILECVEKENVTQADKSRAYVFAFLMFVFNVGKVSLQAKPSFQFINEIT